MQKLKAKKPCVECEYPCYPFSKGRCKLCASKSYAKKSLEKKKDKSLVLDKVEYGGIKISKHTLQVMAEDKKFRQECWDSMPHVCEECVLQDPRTGWLGDTLNSSFISHVLPRGAAPEHRHNPVNVTILCTAHHSKYEFGDRKGMKIWPKCEAIILKLKQEYSK